MHKSVSLACLLRPDFVDVQEEKLEKERSERERKLKQKQKAKDKVRSEKEKLAAEKEAAEREARERTEEQQRQQEEQSLAARYILPHFNLTPLSVFGCCAYSMTTPWSLSNLLCMSILPCRDWST